MDRDFAAWRRSVWDLTAYATLASLIGTGLIAVTLGFAQAALTGGTGTAGFGPVELDLPDATVLVLVLAAALLTVSSVVQTWLRKVDAVLVRRRLLSVTQTDDPLPTRMLMSERFLMEGWTNWVTSLVQAAGFSLLLVWAGGPWTLAGIAVAAGIGIVIGRRFFGRATSASENFLAAQQQANALQKQAVDDPTAAGEVPAALDRVTQAVYRRDNEAFRLAAGSMTLLSIGMIAAAVLPAILTVDQTSLALYLIVLLMWRQRAIDAVTTVGMLAWTLAVWNDSATMSTLDESGFADAG